MAEAPHRLPNVLSDRYRIERELGRGGMATVYLAEDVKHHRSVAIKVLDPELAAAIGPKRFLREIEVAARLNHPQILPLHDSGAAEGLLYYVMPFVEGESLRDRLSREKQLPLDDAVRIIREVADALDYAHGQGVVHRDIKPENILISRGHAVVADFGIARAIRAAGSAKLTETGLMLGTPLYMSPEQAIGGGDLDGRSDQYSLGCVLYEMLAGQPPFTGPTGESLVHQHLSVEPRSVADLRPAVPAGVDRALARALAKTPADRFSTLTAFAEALAAPPGSAAPGARLPVRYRWALVAAAVVALAAAAFVGWEKRNDLRALFGGPVTTHALKKDWILVAEFDGPADDPSLAVAVRDLVGSALDESGIVSTVPRDQVRNALRMAGKPESTRVDADLARELAYRSTVRVVIEGRIERIGKGYSIVLRAVDAHNGKVVVAASELAKNKDALIPSVGRLARRLREGLGENRGAMQANRLRSDAATPSFEAFRKFVEARDLQASNDWPGSMAVAREAVAIDPDFANAWVLIGFCYASLGKADSALVVFHSILKRPERLAPSWRLTAAAAAAILEGDLPASLTAHDKLVRENPNLWPAFNNRAFLLRRVGRHEEALEDFRRAEEASPFGVSQIVLLGKFDLLLFLGRVNEARRMAGNLRGVIAGTAPLYLALGSDDWLEAERVKTAIEADLTAPREVRIPATMVSASIEARRGSARAAALALDRARAEAEAAGLPNWIYPARRARVLLAAASGRPLGKPDAAMIRDTSTAGTLTLGLWAAVAGDTVTAGRAFRALRARPASGVAREGAGPLMLQAWLAARASRWDEVVRVLTPAALQGQELGSVPVGVGRMPMLWLMAEAHEQLGRPDSAAAYLELVLSPARMYSEERTLLGIPYSFAHQRLVLLYARTGRLTDAERHWKIFSETFTHPDPELRHLVDDARSALVSARGMSRSERR